MVQPKRPQKSVKQILVRDFNWRMGNLRRLEMSLESLDADIRDAMNVQLRRQVSREIDKHQARLQREEATQEPLDWIHMRARQEAERNMHR